MRLGRCLAVALSGAALLAATAAAEPPLPYRLQVTAEYGDPLGPESLRAELERELLASLRDARCFSSVERLSSEPGAVGDLLVEVVLDRFDQSAEYDVGIATQHRPDTDPETRSQWTARVKAVLYVQVRRAGDRALVKLERTHASASRRASPGAEPRREAYADLVEAIVRKTRSYLCKPSAKKWERQIRDARVD